VLQQTLRELASNWDSYNPSAAAALWCFLLRAAASRCQLELIDDAVPDESKIQALPIESVSLGNNAATIDCRKAVIYEGQQKTQS
jgi:hypothetical protein